MFVHKPTFQEDDWNIFEDKMPYYRSLYNADKSIQNLVQSAKYCLSYFI